MSTDEQIQCVIDLTGRVAKKVIEEIKAGNIPAEWEKKHFAMYFFEILIKYEDIQSL